MLTQLVGNLPPSSFYLPCISLSHFAPASACPLQPFTSEPKAFTLCLPLAPFHTLLGSPCFRHFCLPVAPPHPHPTPSASLLRPSSPASLARRSHPSVFHRRFRKSQPLPSIYEIAHVISCPRSLTHSLPSSPPSCRPPPPPCAPTLPHKSLRMHPLSPSFSLSVADSLCLSLWSTQQEPQLGEQYSKGKNRKI